MSDTDTKAVLRKLLQDHVGRENGITQGKLATALDLPPSTVRSEIRRLREERGIPIGNLRDGYFVIGDREELGAYIGHINNEIESKKRTIRHTKEAFYEFDDDAEPDDADVTACERCGDHIYGKVRKWFSTVLCEDCYNDAPGTKPDFQKYVAEGSA